MENDLRAFEISEAEKSVLIDKLTEELPVLRTKIGISQDELANMVGITRQTYSQLETKKRKMSWSTFLSLILIFDYNEQTHKFVHSLGRFPKKIVKGHNVKNQGLASFVTMENDDIRNHLDEQAIHAIETVIMMEYARCNNISGEAVIKAFDGRNLTKITDKDVQAQRALKNIKKSAETRMDG